MAEELEIFRDCQAKHGGPELKELTDTIPMEQYAYEVHNDREKEALERLKVSPEKFILHQENQSAGATGYDGSDHEDEPLPGANRTTDAQFTRDHGQHGDWMRAHYQSWERDYLDFYRYYHHPSSDASCDRPNAAWLARPPTRVLPTSPRFRNSPVRSPHTPTRETLCRRDTVQAMEACSRAYSMGYGLGLRSLKARVDG
eukprot:scaffold201_cov405-Prasinococcus_capsulatus_cf.AAC.56